MKLNLLLKYCFVITISISAASCINEEEVFVARDIERVELIYIASDNNLDEFTRGVAEKIRSGWQYTGNRTLIYFDSRYAPPKLLSIHGDCPVYPEPYIAVVETYEEEHSANAEVMGRVMRRVRELYPAESYGLIFSSHSSGWLPEGTYTNPFSSRSIGHDGNGGSMSDGRSEMNLDEFANAIPDGEFDYIIFETCLMAGVEVAYELRNKAKYIVASSAEILGDGFNFIYPTAHRLLMETNIPLEVALKEFNATYMNHMKSFSGIGASATMGIIKTEKLEELAMVVADVFQTNSSEITNIEYLQHFDRHAREDNVHPQRLRYPRFFDFEETLEQIAQPQQMASVRELLKEIVIWKDATSTMFGGEGSSYDGFNVDRHSGMTIYIPQDAYLKLNESYKTTEWYKATRGE